MLIDSTLFRENEAIVIGVSGGLDSVVLLHCLVGISQTKKLKIIVCHLNHQIRAVNSDLDAQFVEELAKGYGLDFILGIRNVPKFAEEQGLSLEDAARALRYDFLKQQARECGSLKIAVAHNLNDQVETIVMRFLRGSAAKGLSGMAVVRSENGLDILRPLLSVTRAEIELYAKQNNLKHREDETNKETIYLRNKIRHELIPTLEGYNSNLKESILRMAEIFRDEDSFMDAQALIAYKELVLKEEDSQIKLDSLSIKNYPKAIQRRVVRLAIEKLCGYLNAVSLLFIENFLDNNLGVLRLDDKGRLFVEKA